MSMTTMEYYDKNVESNGTYVPVERYVDGIAKHSQRTTNKILCDLMRDQS